VLFVWFDNTVNSLHVLPRNAKLHNLNDLSMQAIPSIHLRDNSVHSTKYSPFWVGIFITFKF